MFTDEQLKILLGMGDLSGEEASIAQQGAMAHQLRQIGQNNRTDVGSNIGRALGGIGAAIGNYKGSQQTLALGDKRRALLQSLFGGGAPVVNADVRNY